MSFKVSNVFSDNMVLQRGEYVRVWGFADANENGQQIRGEFKGANAKAVIENGEWILTFEKEFATDTAGAELKVCTDRQSVVFKNVLVGDVYLVTGQSNAAYPMQDHWRYLPEGDGRCPESAVDPELPIRLYYNTGMYVNGVKRRGTEEVAEDVDDDKCGWTLATLSRLKEIEFTALGYIFAYKYVKLTDSKVPCGIVEIDGNGRSLGAFLPNEIAEKYHTDTFSAEKGCFIPTGLNAEWGRFLYNEYFHPFRKLAIKGMVWYQGESDLIDTDTVRYNEIFKAFVEFLRGTHNVLHKDFPVYFMEFPPEFLPDPEYKGKDPWAFLDVGRIRANMGTLVNQIPDTYQIQSSDLWNDRKFWNSLHPNCKYEQAVRLANVVCAVNGEASVKMDDASGPVFDSVVFSDDGKLATVKFRYVGDGLKTTDGSAEVRGFFAMETKTVIAQDPVKAVIVSKDTVEISCGQPFKGIAYNAVTTDVFGKELTLANSAGLPAGSFFYGNTLA